MRGVVSFHPVDVGFFDDVVGPLTTGRKVNPESYLAAAIRIRRTWWGARRLPRALDTLVSSAGPPEPEPGSGFLRTLRSRLERIDYRPDELTRRAVEVYDPDLHMFGRPFFVAEGSAEKVAEAVDAYRQSAGEAETADLARRQLELLDRELAERLEPEDGPEPSADLSYRGDLLERLKAIHDLPKAAREGTTWGPAGGARRPASETLVSELAWRAVEAHARAVPFWTARDVDGLETVCRAAAVPAPACFVSARRLLAEACEAFPELGGSLGTEISAPRGVGAFVSPAEVPELVEYLGERGAQIIRVAARQGEGPACTSLLRKIKECAVYAARHGMGYLEASGILPPDLEEE